jgi:hypothetical protein
MKGIVTLIEGYGNKNGESLAIVFKIVIELSKQM